MKCEIDFEKIGMRIKTLRNNCNMTQEKLAEKTGLSLSHICNLENGHSKMSVESLITIADALSVSTDAILFGEISHCHDDDQYYKDFVDVMFDCTDFEKGILIENALYMKDTLRRRPK